MKNGLLTCALVLCCAIGAKAQLEGAHWFFGDSIILKFTEDSIIVEQAQLSSEEGTSIISTKEGNLLFYSNSGIINNSLHGAIHDEPLFAYGYDPENPGHGNGFMETSLILPNPLSPDTLFYLLNWGDGLIDYTAIDLSLNAGQGGLIDSLIGIDLGDSIISCDTKLTAVRHGNGRDWWVFIRTAWSANPPIMFLRWLLTPNGFEGPDYIELTDWVEEDGWYFGNMFFSQDGERLLVIEKTGFEVYDFNRCTGELIQTAIVDTIIDSIPEANYYCAALSETGNMLYISFLYDHEKWPSQNPSGIVQLDLTYLPDVLSMKENSRIVYFEDYDRFAVFMLKYEHITDNVYFTLTNSDSLYSHNLYLHAITEPEQPGILCNVQENYIQLATDPGGMRTLSGLPNMPNYALGAWEGSPCDTLDETNALVEETVIPFNAYPNPVQDYLFIDNPLQTTCQAVVYNAMGQEVERFILQVGGQMVNTNAWPTGIYHLIIQQENSNIWKQSLVKMEPR